MPDKTASSKANGTRVETPDVQAAVDEILEHLGLRLSAGSLVIHLFDGRVKKIETTKVIKDLNRQSTWA